MSAKLHEAQEHCKAADKFLKTSFLKWKPDYDSAADEYSQAAQCYRIARDLQTSKDCYFKASELYKKNRAFFHAAKALENAIIVGKEMTPPDQVLLVFNNNHITVQDGRFSILFIIGTQ
ncbi:jg5601 [Pararge aegeria aegeria]|uniref:Gamma-soluble NSF attachment protein n=1 Tax=Pararge aegeria aegeria TaxID=348720 RepID=A0A8S4QB08_9NEOP|nr:jg5601 [Pararge aegeria aegeria]